MNKTKNEGWFTGWGGVSILHTPTISASIEYRKNGYYITLNAQNTIQSNKEFKTLEQAKEYAVRLMMKMTNQSLQVLNSSLQVNHERASN